MKASCRSWNLIYCVLCWRCSKLYVGQTSLRLKARFVHHYDSVDKNDLTKPVGGHFWQMDHRGTDYMIIHVLEFIQKPPKGPAATIDRSRVEKRWILRHHRVSTWKINSFLKKENLSHFRRGKRSFILPFLGKAYFRLSHVATRHCNLPTCKMSKWKEILIKYI